MAKRAQSKQRQKKDPEQKAQRNLDVAQQELEQAREKYVQAMARADKLLEKARMRVERRTKAVSAAEAELLSLSPPVVETPAQSVDVLQALTPSGDHDVDLIAATTVSEQDTLPERERTALSALLALDADGEVTAAEWRSASGQSETTLSRARETLLERGLVARDGPPGRGARFRVTEVGRSLR